MKTFVQRLLANAGFRSLRQQVDLVVVLALFAFSVLLFGFFELADVVGEQEWPFEARLMLALRDADANRNPVGPHWFAAMWVNITALGSVYVVTLFVSILLGYLAMLKEWRTALVVVGTILGAALLSLLLKDAFDRPRPEIVPHLVDVSSQSFPSGHSLVAAVVYPTLGALITRLVQHVRIKVYIIAVAMLLTVLVGVSRVFLGVHYPTDVLAGWMLGLGWGILCWLGLRALQRGRVVEPPGVPADVKVESDMGGEVLSK